MCRFHDDDRMNLYDFGPPDSRFEQVPNVDAVYVATAHIVGKSGLKSHIRVIATGRDLKNRPHAEIAAKGSALRCALVQQHANEALQATEGLIWESEWNESP